MADRTQERVGQQLGTYRLLRLLGRGGFAEVYLGEHLYLKTHAALKVLLTVLTDAEEEAFVKEAQTLARLTHPHIVRVLDFAVQEGTPFLVMEFAPNGSLRQRYAKGTCLSPPTIVSSVLQVASALQHAHDQRFIHRDVKPENLLLNSRDEVLLSDFGIATIAHQTATQSIEQFAGTVLYAAPEQLLGRPRPASDQYSLAVVVYEWLCGKPPFHGSFLEVSTQHLSAPPPSLCEQVPGMPAAVEQVVLKALAKEPRERFACVQDFAMALQRAWQGGSPPLLPLSEPTLPAVPADDPSSTIAEAILPVQQPIPPSSKSEPMWKVPTPLTQLVGREQDVDNICALLQLSEVHLLTLLGIGGIGKTRLSLQVAREMRPYFADGVCFIPLAAIRATELVVPGIAQELGISESGEQSVFEDVKDFLQDKQMLLLLDNFEQVTAAAPQVEDLLAACPSLKIIVTSRVVLHISAEHEFPVSPLSLPDLSHVPESGIFSQSSAMALFVQRARAVLPGFQITPVNALAIAEICIRLDGLPLAIELAAARIKLLPPKALLSRLSQRLAILTGGARTLPERQQTLRNTLKWSYDLLDAQEQRLFRRLAVFVGGWTLEAVEAINSEGIEADGDTMSALDGVSSLLDKSLLLRLEQEGDEPRLMMLETVREYGLECLRESGEMEITRQLHAAYYLSLVEEAEPELGGPQQTVWLERLEQEHDNLRAAMQWSLERGEERQRKQVALRFGGALRRFWTVRGHWSEGRNFLEQALAGSEGVEASVRAKALRAAASLILDLGDNDRAEELCRESLVLYRSLGDTAGIAFSLYLLGYIAKMKGSIDVARSLTEEALTFSREVGDKEREAWSLYQLATLCSDQGEYDRACALFEESVAKHRELGNKRGIAVSLFGLVDALFVFQGATAQVRALLEEGLALFRELGDKAGIADALTFSGQVAFNAGDLRTAREFSEESVALFKEIGDRWALAQSLCGLAKVVTAHGNLVAAHTLYEESLALAREVDAKVIVASSLEGLASVVALQREPAWAARLWGAAAALREAIGSPLPPVERTNYEHPVTEARTQLGEEAFAAAWAQGRTMPLEQALSAEEPMKRPLLTHSVMPDQE